jgi:hypothetical protein
MASDVDICNLALSHFGQDANVTSIQTPDGPDAEHCKRFYPIARDEMLEEFDWSFARKRATLAAVTNDREDWAYKYAIPSDCLKERRALPEGYADNLADGIDCEKEGDFLYTNEDVTTLVYTKRLTDTTKFSPLFVSALSWRLASYLVGPITKDVSGGSQIRLRQTSEALRLRAATSDTLRAQVEPTYTNTAQRAR